LYQFSLTVPRYHTLKHIHEDLGGSLTTLSALMLNDKRNINRLLGILEGKGWLCCSGAGLDAVL
jgi:DNA-binding MarR family transcriptional regulator